MQLQKLFWALQGGEITSISIHSRNPIVAVVQDGNVNLFRTNTIAQKSISLFTENSVSDKNKEDNDISVKLGEEDPTRSLLQQLVCTVQEYATPINCVRFGPSSKENFIATCSADGHVFIFKKSDDQLLNTEDSTTTKEMWNQQYHKFKEHSGSVHCVEWSLDGRCLATCALDNKIIIYNVESKTVLQSIKTNDSPMSLSWDPIGSYLAVVAEDKQDNINIYSTSSWTLEVSIAHSAKFRNLTHTSWSPNGQALLSTGHSQGTLMFLRDTFELAYKYKGHKDATSLSVFNPILFVDEMNPQDYISYFAIVSLDKRISIWSNKKTSPIALISTSEKITDLAWSSDGRTLLASSIDGTLTAIQFMPDELGEPLNNEQLKILLRNEYGNSKDFKHLLQEYNNSQQELTPVKHKERDLAPVATINTLQIRRLEEKDKNENFPINRLQIRRREDDAMQQVQAGGTRTFKRAREESVILQDRFSKRIKPNEEENVSFVIRLQKQGLELKCTNQKTEMIDTSNGESLWKIHINGTPSLAVSNANYTAVATSERTLYIISQNGRLISPEMILDSPAIFLACSKTNYLVVLCDNCNMYAWNLSTQQCIMDINVYDLLTVLKDKPEDIANNYEMISSLFITDSGTVVIITYSGEAFAYDTFTWRQWIRVMDSTLYSVFKNLSPKVLLINPHDEQSSLKRIAENEALSMSKKPLGIIKSTHEEEDLETLMAISAFLKDSEAYISYAKLYVQHASLEKLKEFFQQLLLIETKYKQSSYIAPSDEFKIAGILRSKSVLELLLVVLESLNLHLGVVQEYKSHLKALEEMVHGIDNQDFARENGQDNLK